MDNNEGEDSVKITSRVDCVFEINDELTFIRCFHGVNQSNYRPGMSQRDPGS